MKIFYNQIVKNILRDRLFTYRKCLKGGLKLRDMRTSASGQIFTCNRCNKIHFEFSTIAINFLNIEALKEFLIYLKTIDAHGFEKKNRHNNYRRKIAIPFPDTTIRMMLSVWELMEMIELVKDYIKHDTGFVSTQNDFPGINLN